MEHEKRDEIAMDEKLENEGIAQGSTTVSAEDAAMTRRILLKLDFRCVMLLFTLTIVYGRD